MLYDFKGIYFKMSKIKLFFSILAYFDNLKVVHVFTEQFKHHFYEGNGFIGTFYCYKMSNMKFTDKAKLFQAANLCIFIGSKFLLRE